MKKLFTLLSIMLVGSLVFGQKANYTQAQIGNWNEATTWVGGNIPPNPGPSGDLIFLKHDITITNAVVLNCLLLGKNEKDILISGSGSLTVNPLGRISLKDDGTFSGTTNANFIIKSDATGTGSFLWDGTPNGTLECFVAGGSWHLIGPPSSGQNASDYFLTGYMQTWDDGDPGSWTIQEGNPALSRGAGAAYYFYSDFTAGLYGHLNGDENAVFSLGNAGGSDDGYHLLANPFPCGIDIDNCTKTSGIAATAQVYNGSSYIKPTDHEIGPSQGFFIQVNQGSSNQTFTFPVTAKKVNGLGIQKDDEEEYDLMQITLKDNAGKSNDQLTVQFNDEATFDYDSQYDAHKITGNPIAGEMMAQITDTEFACVLGIPFPVETTTVAVNFTKGDESEYTIELERYLLDNIKVTLEDTETGFVIDLSETPIYTFTAEESKDGRFLLHFKSVTGVQELSDTDPVRIWNLRNEVYIQQDQPEEGIIYIYDISGKLVYSQDIDAAGLQKIQLNGPQGAYIVKLISGNQSYSQKIIK